MKVVGQGFRFFLDGVEIKSFEKFEKAIAKIEVTTEVDGKKLEIHAKKR
jgi:hypothetical protein